jgi:predicted Zn-ribbon and HTH transcriptional regulator
MGMCGLEVAVKPRYQHIWSGLEELKSLSADAKNEAVRQCMRERVFTSIIIVVTGLGCAGVSLYLLEESVPRAAAAVLRIVKASPLSAWMEVVLIVLAVAIVWASVLRAALLLFRSRIRADLRSRFRVSRCEQCGYNLAGLLNGSSRGCCPECAASLPRSVASPTEHEAVDLVAKLPSAWGRKSSSSSTSVAPGEERR